MDIGVWIVIAFVAGAIEATTTALVSVWFAVGAVCAAVSAAVGLPVNTQVIVFLGISALLLLATLPLCKKLRNRDKNPTNADRLIGETGIITEDVDPLAGTGEVKVKGQRWSVQVRGDGRAKAGDTVKVENIVGVHLVVSIIKNTEGNEE